MSPQTQLQELRQSLAKLNKPYFVTDLINLFDRYQILLGTPPSEKNALYSEWKCLNTIYNQCLKYQTLTTKSETFKKKQARKLKLSADHSKPASALLTPLEHQYAQLKKDIEPQFQRLLNEFNAHNMQVNGYTIQLSALDLDEQLSTLESYHALLQTQINAISLEMAQLAFYNNRKQHQDIISQLQQQKMTIPSSVSLEQLPALKEEAQEHLRNTQKTAQSLDQVHQLFAKYLSIENTKSKLDTLTRQKDTVHENLQTTTKHILDTKLDASIVQKITTNFNEASDKTRFVYESQQKLDQQASHFNVHAWYHWATNTVEFKQDLEACSLELQLAQLLLTQHHLQSESQSLDQQIQAQQSMLDHLIKESGPLARPEIPTEIANLLAVDSSKPISTIDNIVLFKQLIIQIQSIEEQISRQQAVLSLLDQLTKIEQAGDAILHHVFSELNATCNYLSDAKAFILEKSQTEQRLKLEKLKENALSCEACEKSLATLKNLSKQIENEHAELTLTKPQKKRLQQQCSEETQRIEQIAQLNTQITLNLTEFLEAHASEEEPEHKASTQHASLQAQLNEWNIKINVFLQNMSTELRNWYKELFQTLQEKATEETSLLQSIQLLHDIHFELNETRHGETSPVLRTYCLRYSNLQTDYKDLLQLKPALMLIENPDELPNLEDYPMQQSINKLYRHQQRLASRFPKEAALLKQATMHFHQMALDHEKKKGTTRTISSAFYRYDPRYQCLERHRGFGRAWEWLAELCTKLLNKMKKTPNADYRNRFFFVSTESKKLLDHAEICARSQGMLHERPA